MKIAVCLKRVPDTEARIVDIETGTRELTAHDYVYAIRRLATPRIKSPSFSLMSEYIVGLKDLSDALKAENQRLLAAHEAAFGKADKGLPWIDLRKFPLAGVEVLPRRLPEGLGGRHAVEQRGDRRRVGLPRSRGARYAEQVGADDGADVGEDSGAPVSPDYGPVGNGFNGEVKGALLSIKDDPNNSDHLVKPEDAIKAALGRQ